jgi:hypothetical protein
MWSKFMPYATKKVGAGFHWTLHATRLRGNSIKISIEVYYNVLQNRWKCLKTKKTLAYYAVCTENIKM